MDTVTSGTGLDSVWRALDGLRDTERDPVIAVLNVVCALVLVRIGDQLVGAKPEDPSLRFSNLEHLPASQVVSSVKEHLVPAAERGDLWSDPPTPGLADGLRSFCTMPEDVRMDILHYVGGLSLAPLYVPVAHEFDRFVDRALQTARWEISTPRPVAELMVELAKPQPDETVCDPCSGLGSTLAEAVEYVWRNDGFGPSLVAFERDPLAHMVGVTRLALRGCEVSDLRCGDGLAHDELAAEPLAQVDCVLAAPPLGGRIAPVGRFPESTNDIASNFIQRIMEILRPGGRAVVAVPNSFLFKASEQAVRRRLLEDFQVEGVVALPSSPSFGTLARGSILIFRREAPLDSVRFMDLGEHLAKTRRGTSTFRGGEAASDWFSRSSSTWEELLSDLAKNDWQLVGSQFTRKLEAGFISEVCRLDPTIEIRPLGEIVDVARGIGYRRDQTTTSGGALHRLVRVGDIRNGIVEPGDLFLAPNAAVRIPDGVIADPSDVLLTISGTIGKVGRYTEIEGFGQVPTHGVAVLRCHSEWLRDYLSALLESRIYQDWLTGAARGTGLQHVGVRDLRSLPIPLPSPERAEELVVKSALRGHDLASTMLASFRGDRDPLAEWLETSALQDWHEKADSEAHDTLGVLTSITDQVAALQAERRLFPSSDERLQQWFSQFADAIVPLQALPYLADPQAIVATLALTRAGLIGASPPWEASRPLNLATAEFFTSTLLKHIDRELKTIFDDVSVSFDADPIVIEPGRESAVSLSISNNGPLPLASLVVETTPDIGRTSHRWLPVDGVASAELTVPPAIAGHYEFQVGWSARRLDGKQIKRSTKLALLVSEDAKSRKLKPLGATPYIVGTPIAHDRSDMLYGRSGLLEEIRRQLPVDGGANVIILEGNRRAGKTSVLNRLMARGELPGWIVAYCSFQAGGSSSSKSGVPTEEAYRLVALAVGRAAITNRIDPWPAAADPPDPNRDIRFELNRVLAALISGTDSFVALEEYIDTILDRASKHCLLLLFDEFDKLREGIANGVTSPQVPENLRYLLQSRPRLSAVLTGTYQLKRAREDYWSALFGLGTTLEVRAIDEGSARRLIREPVSGSLAYSSDAVSRIAEVCACQPFLIQHLSNNVFSLAAETNRRAVDADMVEEAILRDVHKNEHFATVWSYARTPRRQLLVVLCHQLVSTNRPPTFDLLESELQQAGALETEDHLLDLDIKELRELELIELYESQDGAAYRLVVPLMGYWIESTQDVVALKRAAAWQYQQERGV